MRPDQVIIHLIDPSRITNARAHLTDAELTRAASFRSQADSDHWAACRAGLRLALGQTCWITPKEVPIAINPHGKPLLDPPFAHVQFNLSHCRDLALVAIAATPVGIDLERSERAADLLGCEETFCHPEEIVSLLAGRHDRSTALLDIWTAKESALKALGTGFLLPPDEVMIGLETTPGSAASVHEPQLGELRIHRLHHAMLADHTAYLAISAAVPNITYQTDFI